MSARGAWTFLAGASCALALGCAQVDPGQDLQIAEVVYDEAFFYCTVEPMLFARKCGAGDPGSDGVGGCHFNVTAYRLTDYSPLVQTTCNQGLPQGSAPGEAQQNYQTSQVQMARDPELAPLLNRPTRRAFHPRQIFRADDPDADTIRTWATQYSSQ